MHDHPLILIYAVLAAIITAVVAAIATRVRLLPEVIDLSLMYAAIVAAVFAALPGYQRWERRQHPRRRRSRTGS